MKTVKETKEKKRMITEKMPQIMLDNSMNTENSLNFNKDSMFAVSHRNIGQKSKKNINTIRKMPSINQMAASKDINFDRSEGTVHLPQVARGMRTASNLNSHQKSSGRLVTRTTQYNTSARDDHMTNTLGMSKASMLGTRQSDFFTDLDQEPELLNRFRQSQIDREEYSTRNGLEKTNRVAAILSRTKCMGNKTHLSCFTGRQKSILMKATTPAELEQVKETFNAQNQKDLKNLESKSNDLTKELNSTINNVAKKQKLLQKLEETYERLLKEKKDRENFEETDLIDQNQDLANLQKKYESMQEFEKRMTRIIDLCGINKSQNDDWLSQLNYYSENLKKCTAEQKVLMKVRVTDAKQAHDRVSALVSDIKGQKASNDHLIASLAEVEHRNKVIQSHFFSTDDKVKRSVLDMRRNLEDSVQDRIRQIDGQTRDEEVAVKNRAIRVELDILKRNLEKYSDLFADGENGEDWQEKPEMKELLENLIERKELEKVLMQKKFDLRDLQLKNNETHKKIDVIYC